MFIQKYINLYYNKGIAKCVANAIQTSRLFLGVSNKVKSSSLAMALSINNLELITLIKKKVGRYYTMESQILLSEEAIVNLGLRGKLDGK